MSLNKENIEAIYPLSPMQEGMLFHSLVEDRTGAYFEQYCCTYQGSFDVAVFQQAWAQVIDRHPVLRTLVMWEREDQALQVVRKQVTPTWAVQDWRGRSQDQIATQLELFLQEDRARGFDLTKAPLTRFAVFHLADDAQRFVWSFHHLLLDGWSVPLILNEVYAYYQGLLNGAEVAIKRPRPYRDYISWLQKQDLPKAETFWKERLRGYDTPARIPTSSGSGLTPGAQVVYRNQAAFLSEETTSTLKTLARDQKLTLNTIAQGAWSLLISRYSGSDDVVFGSTVSGRPAELSGVEEMIGIFINTLPIRIQIPGASTIAAWLQDIQAQQVDLRDYEYSPLYRVQQWSQIPRGQPLFESIVLFENYPVVKSTASGRRFEILNVDVREDTDYPLTIGVEPADRLTLRITYDSGRYADDAIQRMLGHFKSILEAIARDPQQSLSEIDMLTHQERRQLLEEWNDTTRVFPEDLCVHRMFEQQAAITPNATAVVFNDASLTYSGLDRRANQLAHYLQTQGVGPDVLVGLCVERSADMVVAMLAILKAGGAYLPLDPEFPVERLAFIISDAKAHLLLTEEHLRDRLPAETKQTVYLDGLWSRIDNSKKGPPTGEVGTDNLAYVIYTSGSTGKPKGVEVPHRAVVNFLSSMACEPGIGKDDTLLAVTTLSFDISVLEIFLPLTVGAKVNIADRDTASDGTKLLDKLAESGATVMQATPATWRLLISAEWPGSAKLKVLCGGEPLPGDLAGALLERAASVWNMYGPTETTVWSSCYPVTDAATPIPIGRPIANTRIYILDRYMRPLPIGIPGEIYVGGAGVARGYLGRDELTRERFVADPFGNEPGARLYRTGDLARYRGDGALEYCNRQDNQVKVRGYRIELGEVETTLAQHATIRQVVAMVREDRPDDRRLVAYYLPEPGSSVTATDLRKFLRAQLPEYMVPQHFVELDVLPLTPNGKIDRRSLPAPAGAGKPSVDAAIPKTESEIILAAIWKELIGVGQVGLYDNFFELGGHSLLAIQAIARIKKAMGVQLGPRKLLLNNLLQIAKECDEKKGGGTDKAGNKDEKLLAGRILERIKDKLPKLSS